MSRHPTNQPAPSARAFRPETLRLAGTIGCLALLFVVDLWTPPGVVVWAAYLIVIWYASTFRWGAAHLLSLSAAATLSLIAAGWMSDSLPFWAVINRVIGILLIWCATIVLRRQAAVQAESFDREQGRSQHHEDFAAIFTHIGDAVMATDRAGRVTLVNARAAQVLGRSCEDIQGRLVDEVLSLIDDATGQPLENPITRVLANGAIVGMTRHTALSRPDGSRCPVESRAAPIRQADGRLIGSVLILQDLTDRKQAEQTHTLLSAVVASTDDAIISKNPSNLITSWNRAAERMFGYAAQETLGRPLARFLHADLDQRDREALTALRDRQEVGRYETVRRKKDGTLCEIAMSVAPLLDAEGDVIGAALIGRDVTERKRVERALHDSQERLTVTLQHIRDAVVMTDHDTRITFLNPAAEELLACERSNVLGCPLLDIFHPIHEDTGRPMTAGVDQVMHGAGEVRRSERTVLLRSDGTEVPIDDCAIPLLNAERAVIGVVLVFRERTTHRDRERSTQQWTADVEQRVLERTHALVRAQTGLRALVSQLGLAQQQERVRLATDLHESLAQWLAVGRMHLGQALPRLRDQAPTLEALIRETDGLLDHCLTYTRTIMARLSPPILADMGLASALRWLGEQMKDHRLSVQVQVPERPVPLNEQQAAVLFQCAREVLMNVAQHAQVDRVSLSLTVAADGEVMLVVEDQGIGFDVTKPRDGRSGAQIGLLRIQEQMETVGGWSLIRSSSGAGTRIELGLTPLPQEPEAKRPLTADAALLFSSRSLTASPADTSRTNRRRILLVDDHAMIRQGLRSILDAHSDVEVIGEAADGEEAVSMTQVHRPDLVVMDLTLPKLNGIEATRRIKKTCPQTLVIGLSVHASPHRRNAMRDAGGAALLGKEEASDLLHRTITEVWQAHRTPRL